MPWIVHIRSGPQTCRAPGPQHVESGAAMHLAMIVLSRFSKDNNDAGRQ
jgi:hypothetical protein